MDLPVSYITLSCFRTEKLTKVGDEEITDILEANFPMVDYRNTDKFVRVTQPFAGRTDLVSDAIYSTSDYTDVICNFNGISNPISIEEDQVLAIPNLTYTREYIQSGKQTTESKSKTALKANLNNKDKRRLAKSVEIGEIKTPNMPLANTTPTIAQNGFVELGTNVSTTKCPDKMSNTELLSSRIREAVKAKLQAS